jgi:hypothetical protein
MSISKHPDYFRILERERERCKTMQTRVEEEKREKPDGHKA